MPSEPMNIQEQGFRSSLFGFDKNDVLAYMNALANEAQQHELEYNRQLQQLQSKLDELRSERGTADSRMEALKAELAAVGYNRYRRSFTPREVSLLVKYLGEP